MLKTGTNTIFWNLRTDVHLSFPNPDAGSRERPEIHSCFGTYFAGHINKMI